MPGSPHPPTLPPVGPATGTPELVLSHGLAVAIGGAAGAVLRYLVSHAGMRLMPEHPERATLAINAAGSLLLGAMLAWTVSRPEALPPVLQAGLAVGLLGAFTTYSTFSVEALKMMQAGRLVDAAVYVLTTTVLCIALAAAGYGLMAMLASRPAI